LYEAEYTYLLSELTARLCTLWVKGYRDEWSLLGAIGIHLTLILNPNPHPTPNPDSTPKPKP